MGSCWGWLGVRIDGSGDPGPPGPVQAAQHTEFMHAIHRNRPIVCVKYTHVHRTYTILLVKVEECYNQCIFISMYACMYKHRYMVF